MNIEERIRELRRDRKAVILAHNYQLPEIQDIADFVGDSLNLSMKAAQTDADMIVFCGVHFMAETAKILSPEKLVVLPDLSAGCPMADMIDAGQLRELKKEHPGAGVVAYVNTTAEVKAECDYCCTSANAERVVRKMLERYEEIIFVPDKHLGHYVSQKVGRGFILWNGFCPTHARIMPEEILKQKSLHPKALVLAHPECTSEVLHLADQILSTEGMCRFAADSTADEFIVATEVGILHRMGKLSPTKRFYPASDLAVCPNMKRINLEKVLRSLEEKVFEITVPEEISSRARAGIEKMLVL
ncbi:MAG TPA: quinolinate synthase [Deltaproteobacteria bacterium]|nr:quinolinate synthase [Deltaproteobacteria bacterium]